MDRYGLEIGDKVRLIDFPKDRHDDMLAPGDTGVVVAFDGNWIGVDWGKDVGGMVGPSPCDPANRGWWVKRHVIEPVVDGFVAPQISDVAFLGLFNSPESKGGVVNV